MQKIAINYEKWPQKYILYKKNLYIGLAISHSRSSAMTQSKIQQFQKNLNKFGQVWTKLQKSRPIRTSLDQFGQICKQLPMDSGMIKMSCSFIQNYISTLQQYSLAISGNFEHFQTLQLRPIWTSIDKFAKQLPMDGGSVKNVLCSSSLRTAKLCSKIAYIMRPIPNEGSITLGVNFST